MVVVGKTSSLTIIGLEDVRLSTLELCWASTFDPRCNTQQIPPSVGAAEMVSSPAYGFPPKRVMADGAPTSQVNWARSKRRTLISGSVAKLLSGRPSGRWGAAR
jgi:hypothetical protein